MIVRHSVNNRLATYVVLHNETVRGEHLQINDKRISQWGHYGLKIGAKLIIGKHITPLTPFLGGLILPTKGFHLLEYDVIVQSHLSLLGRLKVLVFFHGSHDDERNTKERAPRTRQ